MPYRLAIDFGTTNSVIVHQSNSHVDVLPLIPSLLYVEDGRSGQAIVGEDVKTMGLDQTPTNRLFRNFKRGMVTTPAPAPREIDGALWDDQAAGNAFIRHLLSTLPYDLEAIDQIVLTSPVMAFENYLSWLTGMMKPLTSDTDRIRLVDESTAAALGYAVTEPGAIVLVFDFGGGTLDLSLVQLPESREKTGSFLGRMFNPRQQVAKVIAKSGRVLGGSDIDQWLLAEVLSQTGLVPSDLGSNYAALLTLCEQAKIALSTQECVSLDFTVNHHDYHLSLTRADLETILEQNGFYAALRHVIEKVMVTARQQGIFKADIHYVLLVGGVSLMPSVQALLGHYFTKTAIRADKPFTAVAEGALQVALGYGLDDYLNHSYGIRYLDDHEHHYEELIPSGTHYPTDKPVEITLGAAHARQSAIEFVIGEVETDSTALVEMVYEDGQAVFVAQADQGAQQIVPLNLDAPRLVYLVPNAKRGEDRIRAAFRVDAHRQLRLTVLDLKTREELLHDEVVVTLK